MGVSARTQAGVLLVAAAVAVTAAGCASATPLVPPAAGATVPEAAAYQQTVELRYQNAEDNLNRAVSEQESALVADPNWAFGHLRLATLFWALHQPTAALAEAQKATRLDPRSDTFEVDLGQMAAAMGQTRAATAAFRAAIRINPGNWTAWDGLASLALAAHDPETALRDVHQSLLLGGPQAPTYDFWGRALLAEGQWGQAATYFRSAQSAAPGWWQPAYDLGRVEVHWGEYSLAAQQLRNALQDSPGQSAPWQLLESLPPSP